MFRRSIYGHVEPFSICIAFSPVPEHVDGHEAQDAPTEWNQDPGTPGNYYRWRSYIQISERMMVDDVCYVRFSITVPTEMLPETNKESSSPMSRRLFNVSVKAYELSNPDHVTQSSEVRFMVVNWRETTEGSVVKKLMNVETSSTVTLPSSEDSHDSAPLLAKLLSSTCGFWGVKKRKEGQTNEGGIKRTLSLGLKRASSSNWNR